MGSNAVVPIRIIRTGQGPSGKLLCNEQVVARHPSLSLTARLSSPGGSDPSPTSVPVNSHGSAIPLRLLSQDTGRSWPYPPFTHATGNERQDDCTPHMF